MLGLRRTKARLRALRRAGTDEGFTLVEVLVAIVLLTIIGLLSAQIAAASIRSVTTIDASQTAVSVATMEMENVRANDATFGINGPAEGDPPAIVSRLFTGRAEDAELAAFAAAQDVPVIANDTYPEWDPWVARDAASPADCDSNPSQAACPTVPSTGTMTLNGVTFGYTVLLGSCYIKNKNALTDSGVTAADGFCGRAPSGVTMPTSAAAPADIATLVPPTLSGYTKMIRAVVVVTWAGGASYVLSSIYEPAIEDQLWPQQVTP